MAMDLSTPGASTSTLTSNENLSYPAQTPRPPSPPPKASTPRELHKNRLYVGNLHPTVDEYTFVQVFSKYGKIARLDFLFHKAGANKGKPRGYAFVEYSNKDDANKALVNAHEKLLRGRKLVVTFAHQAPTTDGLGSTGPGKQKFRKGLAEAHRPTALSLMKATSQPGKTEDKIALLEAKLTEMQRSSSSDTASSSLIHPSLPRKPPPISHHAVTSTPASGVKPVNRTTTTTKAKTKASNGMMGSCGVGKKPTLEELLRSHQDGGLAKAGLLRR